MGTADRHGKRAPQRGRRSSDLSPDERDALTYYSPDERRRYQFRERARRVTTATIDDPLTPRPRDWYRGGLLIREVGCGSGYLALELAKLGHRVLGSDVDELAIHRATVRRDALHDQGWFVNRYAELTAPPPVEFVVEDANRVDTYGEGLFSRFVFGDVLEHLDDPELQIRLVERALRPGGRLVVSVPNKWAPANVAWWARRRMKGYALDEHRHEFTRLELGTLLGRYLTDIRFEYANVVPHWFGLPVDAMRRAERVALRRRPVLERLGWTMIATGTKR